MNTTTSGKNFGFSNAFGKRKQHQPREKSQYQLNREKELENERIEKSKKDALEVNDFNFPSLGINSWNNTGETINKSVKSFSALASNWGEQDSILRNKLKNNDENDLLKKTKEKVFKKSLPSFNFGSSHSRQEDTYEEEEDTYPSYVTDTQPVVQTFDEWKTVERKLPIKSKDSKKFVPISEHSTRNEEDSVWNTEEDHDWKDPREKDSVW